VRYYIDGASVHQWGQVAVKDASIKSVQNDAELGGVNGHVWTRDFSRLETPPNQTLSVESGRQGKMNVSKGQVNFRIDPGNIIFVESAKFGFAGGELTARGFRVAPAESAADLYLYADNIDVGELAKIASDGKVTGTGKLYGRLPVSVKYPDRLTLGEGYVYAEAPGGDTARGQLQLGEYADQVTGMAVGQMPPNAVTEQVKKQLQATLANFNYGSLVFELKRPEDGTLKVTLRAAGKGASPTGSVPLDLTLNLSGLEDAIRIWLGMQSKL
jgi:hypothetical protein